MFTTMAHAADYVFLLARTDPDVAKHRGLSMFLVPLDADGVEIHPVETFGGERTNATFYDNVFVPETMRVGAENQGWSVLGAALTVERAAVGSYVGEARRTFDELVEALAHQDRPRAGPRPSTTPTSGPGSPTGAPGSRGRRCWPTGSAGCSTGGRTDGGSGHDQACRHRRCSRTWPTKPSTWSGPAPWSRAGSPTPSATLRWPRSTAGRTRSSAT